MRKVGLLMKILVIGNGFDLFHGLKTSYTDFLNSDMAQKHENNCWIKYFLNKKESQEKIGTFIGENWVDFEAKFWNVLKKLNGLSPVDVTDGNREELFESMNITDLTYKTVQADENTVNEYFNKLVDGLKELTSYLKKYMHNIDDSMDNINVTIHQSHCF